MEGQEVYSLLLHRIAQTSHEDRCRWFGNRDLNWISTPGLKENWEQVTF